MMKGYGSTSIDQKSVSLQKDVKPFYFTLRSNKENRPTLRRRDYRSIRFIDEVRHHLDRARDAGSAMYVCHST
jgi:hypothetical protein